MSRVPTNLVPTRVTQLPEYGGSDPAGYVPYVLEGRTYKVKFSNLSYLINFSDDFPAALGTASPGVSAVASRGDHVHPAVDLSDPSQTTGQLPLAGGGTGGGLSPVAGAVLYSTSSALALTAAGTTGQAFISSGTGAPTWGTLGVLGGGTGATTLTGYVKGAGTAALTASATIPVADITGGAAVTKADDTNVTLTLGGSPTTALLAATSFTLGWTGQLAVARGGTGAATLTGYVKGNGTSALTASATIPVADITGGAAITKTDDTNVTLTLGGTPTTALLAATSFTLGWSGTLAATRGGTGFGSYAVGDLLYASTTSALSKLAGVAAGNALISGGVNTAPSWGKIALTTHVSGTLPVANGGTGATSLTTGYLPKGAGTGAYTASLVYDSGTNVGVNTASPSSRLHVNDGFITTAGYGITGALIAQAAAGTVGSPAVISATTQLGTIAVRGYDGTTYRDVAAIAGHSNGAVSNTSSPGYLAFATTPSGATNVVERMRIASSGEVGIGMTPISGTTATFQTATDMLVGGVAGNPLVGFNAYYSGGWKAATTGYSGVVRMDTGAGYLSLFTSDSSTSAGGSVAGFNEVLRCDASKNVTTFGTSLWVNSALLVQHDGTHAYIRPDNGGSALHLGCAGANVLGLQSTVFYPITDNAVNCGFTSNRWAQVYAAIGTINTSDEREKNWRGGLTPAELAAAKQITAEIGMYQWLDAIEKKGPDGARYHCGVKAQAVWRIMAAHGLVDPLDADGLPGAMPYGFLCFDAWEESVVPGADGEPDQVTPAGNRYGIRPDELAFFLIAAQEARIASTEMRLAVLEGATK